MARSEPKRRTVEGAPLKVPAKRIALFATDPFAVPTFEAIIRAGYGVLTLVTEPGQLVERGPDAIAGAWRIPTLKMGESAGTEVEALRQQAPDLLLIVGYHRPIPPGVLEIPSGAAIKLHPSLLPRYRGACPIEWGLLNGERATGVTAFLYEEAGDGGPILHSKTIAVGDEDNAGELRSRLSLLAAEVALETLAGLPEGRWTPKPQHQSEATDAPPLSASEARIDWKLPAETLARRIRAFNPTPGAVTVLGGQEVRIVRAHAEGRGSGAPGVVQEARFDGIVVACGENTALRITQLQPEGQRPMSPSAFMLRHRLTTGSRFD